MRSVKAIAGAAMSIAALSLLAACGGGGQDEVGAAPPEKPKPKIDLTVTFVADKGATPKKWHLTCQPSGGDHPNAQAACAKLEKTSAKALNGSAEKRKEMMCTQQFGGPETATVTGTWQGEQINAKYNRQNGCEIGAWNGMKPVIQPAG